VQPGCEHCQPAANRRRPPSVGGRGRDGRVSGLFCGLCYKLCTYRCAACNTLGVWAGVAEMVG
jgi:hypothetical protein